MARTAGDVMGAAIVPGDVLRDVVILAREYAAFTMYASNVLRIIDLEGKQVADTICFNLHDLAEKMNNENTMLVNHTYNPTEGHVVYSDDCNPMFTIIRDTVGRNYPGGAMCSEELNRVRYGVPGTRNCRDNLADAVRPWGFGKRDLPGAFTPFMNVVHYPDGSAEIAEPTSEPGSYIDLSAEMDLLVAISACPQERNPCNAFNPTSLRAIVYHPAD
jgi:uncharacterized protein YcgI (DUF1989 family)